jgi:hypothetical protein
VRKIKEKLSKKMKKKRAKSGKKGKGKKYVCIAFQLPGWYVTLNFLYLILFFNYSIDQNKESKKNGR